MTIKNIDTQVLILGSGPGGYSAAFRCSDLGMNVTLIEKYTALGGVCLNVGCIPSKTLLHIAKIINTQKKLNNYGIFSKTTHFNIEKIKMWKNKIISDLSHNLNLIAKKRNITIINGYGQFIDKNTLQVKLDSNKIINIKFQYSIIAAGSHPITIPTFPKDQRIWNSTDALKLSYIPEKMLIIGSGAIGLEIATIYKALGSNIDLVEIKNQISPFLDSDIINFFTKIITKNINIMVNTIINLVRAESDGIYVTMTNAQKLKNTQKYDAILVAVGRNPNGYQINAKNAGIYIDTNGFILTNTQMCTNIKNIFAIGDIVGHPMLAHKSIHEGHVAAEVIAGKKRYFDPKVIPSIIYTDPEIAWVGITEKEAKNKNINYEVSIFPWQALGRAVTTNCEQGLTKLIFDKKTHRIIGGTTIGTNAGEILGEIALAIEMGCDVEDITLTIHAHPTLYESIALAASIYNGSITDLPNIKKENFLK